MEDRLNELPKGWATARIIDLIEKEGVFIDGDWIETKDQDPNGDVRLIQLADIGDGFYRNKSSRFLTKEKARQLNCTFLQPNDVLIARMPDPLGRACIFPGDDKPCITAVDVCIVRPSSRIANNRWLMHAVNAVQFRAGIESLQSGSTRKRISRSNLAALFLPLPPLPEQHRIVAKIEELFTRLDAGVEALKKIKAQLKSYRQAVLKYAFEGKLTNRNMVEGQLPDGWVWEKIKEITSVLGDGLHGTPLYSESGEYYFINGNNLSDGRIEIKENTKRVTIEEYKKYKKPLNENTIFVSINGTLGNTAFYNGEKVILGKSACYFNILNTVDKQYVRYCITSQRFIDYAYKHATGSTIKNLGLKAMREFEIPLPPTIEEQKHIVSEIESRLSVCNKIEESIDQSLKQSEKLRQSILKRAFEGKLVPRDPTDEPAEKLLERIKEEKAKQEAENRREKKHRNKNSKQMELI